MLIILLQAEPREGLRRGGWLCNPMYNRLEGTLNPKPKPGRSCEAKTVYGKGETPATRRPILPGMKASGFRDKVLEGSGFEVLGIWGLGVPSKGGRMQARWDIYQDA